VGITECERRDDCLTIHQQAKTILERAVPGVSPETSLLARAISILESHYGDGWGKGLSHAGVGSHNWGALTAGSAWRGATFEHKDSRYNPDTGKSVEYVTTFRSYPSDEAGARDLVRVLERSHAPAVALAASHRWADVSPSMGPRGTRFYLGRTAPADAEAKHRARFLAALREIRSATGEDVPGLSEAMSDRPILSAGGSGLSAGLIFLALALWRSSKWR
jgi:hypothetical protein